MKITITKIGLSYRVTVYYHDQVGHVYYPSAQSALDFAHMYGVSVEVEIK